MPFKRPATGLAFCLFYLSSYFTNKYVLSVLKFTYPTLFQGWQTLVGGILLHVSWKIGWVEISSSSRYGIFFETFHSVPLNEQAKKAPTYMATLISFQMNLAFKLINKGSLEFLFYYIFLPYMLKIYSPEQLLRSEVLSWLPASALFVGIIYSGSRALSRLACYLCALFIFFPILVLTSSQPIPIFLTLHNAADVIFYGVEISVQKEQNSSLKLCRVLILLVAAGGLLFNDPQFDIDGYFWALIHLLCVGAYKVFYKLWKPNFLSTSEQQYINYAFSVVMFVFASHPTGDLFSALEFPLLYFYIFHSSCLASGLLGFLLTLYTMKLKSSISSGQYLAWNFLAKVITASLSPFLFEIAVNVPTACCLLLAGFAEILLLYIERTGA